MGTDIARRGNDEQQITNRFLHKSQSCGEKACDKKEIRESCGEKACDKNEIRESCWRISVAQNGEKKRS